MDFILSGVFYRNGITDLGRFEETIISTDEVRPREQAIKTALSMFPRIAKENSSLYFTYCFAVLVNRYTRTPVWSFRFNNKGRIIEQTCEYTP